VRLSGQKMSDFSIDAADFLYQYSDLFLMIKEPH